uniref:Secreted protein n=1 Tax=Streptomyces sp. NBC_00180 TaxID=2903632 RepID=A0AAU1IAV4_9ACTN
MRYARTALAAATAFLALTTLNGTAHANDDHGNGDTNTNCTIKNTGDHNTGACGNISYGDNATTGNGRGAGSAPAPLVMHPFFVNGSLSAQTVLTLQSASGCTVAPPNGSPLTQEHAFVVTFNFASDTNCQAQYSVNDAPSGENLGVLTVNMQVGETFGVDIITCSSTTARVSCTGGGTFRNAITVSD